MSLEAAARCGAAHIAALVVALTMPCGAVRAQSAMPASFVYLRDIDPSIAQDMRYAGPTISSVVRSPAMRRPSASCGATWRRRSGGCRRTLPRRARASRSTTATGRSAPCTPWRNGRRTAARSGRTSAIFPRLQKANCSRTLSRRRLAPFERHCGRHHTGPGVTDASRAVRSRRELWAVHRAGRRAVARRQHRHGHRLRLPRRQQPTRSAAVGAEPRKWRGVLVAAMAKHGFANYFREWWHFATARRTPRTMIFRCGRVGRRNSPHHQGGVLALAFGRPRAFIQS